MTEWTDQQLICVIKAAFVADGGCTFCIKHVLCEFLNSAGWELETRIITLLKSVDIYEYFSELISLKETE